MIKHRFREVLIESEGIKCELIANIFISEAETRQTNQSSEQLELDLVAE